MLKWLAGDDAQIAIFDASNVTIQRRAKLREKVNAAGGGISIVFLESICTNEEVIRGMKMWKVQNSPDFVTMSEADALKDLEQRIEHYEKCYETVLENEGAYIKMYDLRAKASVCNVYGRMAKSVLPFLLAMHAIQRPVLLYILPADDGTDAVTTAVQQHKALCQWAAAYPRKRELLILTSTEARAVATADALADAVNSPNRPEQRPMLAPLIVRKQEGKTSEDQTSAVSFHNKFGERVEDLLVRLEPVVLELEGATTPVIVIAQEAACRTLRAHLLANRPAEMSRRTLIDTSFKSADWPQLIEFAPKGPGGFDEVMHDLQV